MLCVGLSSCSSDDDEENGNSQNLAGTSWIVTSVDDTQEAENMVGSTIHFNSDGTATWNDPADEEGDDAEWEYIHWTYNNGLLKIIYGEEVPDDFMEGTFTMDGNTATYKYHWGDVNGEWNDETYYTMQLKRK